MTDDRMVGLRRQQAHLQGGPGKAQRGRAALQVDAPEVMMRRPDRLSFQIRAAQVSLIEGATGTGKTERLIERAGALLADGAGEGAILIAAQTPLACALLQRQLNRRWPHASRAVRIATCAELERELLSSDAARAITHRRCRTVEGIDLTILDKDLETTGIAIDRIHRAKRAIAHGWARGDLRGALGDDEEATRVWHELMLCLEDIDAMLEDEVHDLAARASMQLCADDAACGVEHLLLDDLHLLCRASQIAAACWARSSLFIACDPLAGAQGARAAAAMDEIAAICGAPLETLRSSHRSETAIEAARFTAARSGGAVRPGSEPRSSTGSRSGSIEVRAFDSPASEVLGIARLARDAASREPERTVAITAAGEAWLENAMRALRALGIPFTKTTDAEIAAPHCALDGDATLAHLAANPRDGMLWRRWCAQGDALANSSLFAALRHGGCRRPLAAALSEFACSACDEPASALIAKQRCTVQGHVERAQRAIADARADAGRTSADAPPSPAATPLPPEERPASIIVGPIAALAGAQPDDVFLIGCAAGSLLPKQYSDLAEMEAAQRQTCRQEAMGLLYASVCRAADRMVFSYSRYATLDEAQALGLKVERIELRDGRRIARLGLDEAVAELHAALA